MRLFQIVKDREKPDKWVFGAGGTQGTGLVPQPQAGLVDPAALIDAALLCLLLALPHGPRPAASPEPNQRAGLGRPPTRWPGLRGWPGVRRLLWNQEVADSGFSKRREHAAGGKYLAGPSVPLGLRSC